VSHSAIDPPGVGLLQLAGKPAPYANGVLVRTVSDLLFVSGQVAFDETGAIRSDDIETQADQALRNLVAVLTEAGSAPEHVVKLTAFLTDRAYVETYVAARERLFAGCRPASTTVICDLVRPEMLIEIEAVAVVPNGASASA
jgi:2-iminobutanoate/2-iminopropanoate deaminase